MTLEHFINWFALLLSVALIIYGVVGLSTGQVTASSYALSTKQSYGGKKAIILSTAWVICGLLGAIAFGGHLMGIKEVAPLYDFFTLLLKSN